MVRLSLIFASGVNAAAGVGLASLWYKFRHDEGMPIVVLFVALSLFVQGVFTMGQLAGLWKQWGIPSFQLFVIGESTAAIVGGVAILQGVIYNLHPINGDYEFGPLLAATLMATQAAIGLVYAARSGEFPLRRNA
ncbi:MAG TPA: hypothetical protein VEK37_01065 [Gemmatimonadaceae bacterium]|nr:hypothetical protein [Gemmatimonadaceae bacterium]